MPNPAALQQIGIAKESTPGTYVAPSTAAHGMLPAAEMTWKAVEPRAEDMGLRGTMRAQLFGAYQTTQHFEITIKGKVFAGSFGHILMSMFGTDTLAGSGPYTHTFSVADTTYPGVATYSITNFDNANSTNALAFTACKGKSVSVEYDKGDLVGFTATYVATGKATQTKPTLAVESGSGFGPMSGHLLALTVGGSAENYWGKFSWEIDRGTKVEHTFNNARTAQAAAVTVAPPTGSFQGTAFYDDQTNYNRMANASESTVVAVVGSTNPLLSVTCTAPDWRTAEVKPGGQDDIQRLDLSGTMKYSSTDSGICSVVLTNSRSSAY